MSHLVTLVIIGTVFTAMPAKAISGTLSGCIAYSDTRIEGSGAAGSRRANALGANKGLKEARVLLINGWGGTTGSSTTGSDGCFSISYSDTLQPTYPVTWTFRTELKSPNQFYVADSWGSLFAFSQQKTLNDQTETMGTLGVDGDRVLVYATSQEYWSNVISASTRLSNAMTNVRIDAEMSGTNSYAVNRGWVRIINGRGQSRPVSSVAHELGHASTFTCLDRDYSIPIGCSGSRSTWTSAMDCEGPAWHEASADFFGTVAQWTNNASDANANMGTGFPVGTVPSACSLSATLSHQVESCIVAAMFDAWDDPGTDDDPINASATDINLSEMCEILDQYANGTGDRQNAEGGSHGNNLWDWLENFDDDFPAMTTNMRTIYSSSGLNRNPAVGEEPF